MKWSSKEFLKLKLEWYDKLKQSGFVDLENPYNEYLPLKQNIRTSTNRFQDFESVEEYYMQCRHFLNVCKTFSQSERQIWALHSEGLSIREIADQVKLAKTTVSYHILKLRNKMYLRNKVINIEEARDDRVQD